MPRKEAGEFLQHLQHQAATLTRAVSTEDGQWIVKGFIDLWKNIYTLSADTKVISKVLELLLFPLLVDFGKKHQYKMLLCQQQSFYPDITFITSDGKKYALDLKTTYRTSEGLVNGMTLGAFTGYFRNRRSSKNITFPYADYEEHVVLGAIYTKCDLRPDEFKVFALQDLESIASVARNIVFFAQPKWKIASTRPGSGNTKHIGSVIEIERLINGSGPFAALGREVFDDYWMYYLTKDMAKAAELPAPLYNDLKSYLKYKGIRSEK
jgi:hypothetical protein